MPKVTHFERLLFCSGGNLSYKTVSSRITSQHYPLNLYVKHWGWGRIPANNQNLLISPYRNFFNKFTSSTIKSFVPSSSNSSLYLITLSFICSCSLCCCITFFNFRLYMYPHTILILINQCLLIVVFNITKTFNGQISPKQHFHYPHFLMLFGKLCFS